MLLPRWLLLGLVGTALGCESGGATLLLTLSSDSILSKYDLYVRDESSRAIIEHTGWSDATLGGKRNLATSSLKIGLSLPKAGSYSVVIVGVDGATDGDRPALGVPQFFFAQTFQVKNHLQAAATLLHVPDGDDQDRDLFPDAIAWPLHVAAAQKIPPQLLDCNDKMAFPEKKIAAAQMNPFATEVCGDGVDENCDGDGDEPCADRDSDGDPDATDCAPDDPKRHHAVLDPKSPKYDPFPESANCCGYSLGKTGADASKPWPQDPTCRSATCDDGIDQDCDGADVQCKADQDCDGYRAAMKQDNGCMAPGDQHPVEPLDCDDCSGDVHPGAAELCDGKDNNCNGFVDETCVVCDLDGDGFQRSGGNCPDLAYVQSGKALDCNDEDAGVFPKSTSSAVPVKVPYLSGAFAHCGGAEGPSAACALRGACRNQNPDGSHQDADCDGTAYKGCPSANCDADGDGFIDAAKMAQCDPQKKLQPYDCDDTDPHTFPNAPPLCGEVKPHNCVSIVTCGTDADKDGYDTTTDCDDTNGAIHPWATEICNGKDDDCDGLVDEGNPDADGKPLVVSGAVIHCNDSGLGACLPKLGDCVCSGASVNGLSFDQKSRAACPGEDAAIDTGVKAGIRAPRCYGAVQPGPQSCDPLNPKDDDCDGRVDAPDGKNFPDVGKPCWPGAVGQCAPAKGGKITGCDMSKSNCFAGLGVNPWLLCDNSAICPVAEKCNGLDDDCNGALPTGEKDLDGDHYLKCGSLYAGSGQGGVSFDNSQVCEVKLALGILGCGDCADAVGMTGAVNNAQIHPSAIELCNNLDEDCNPNSGDGAGECGLGGKALLKDCCSAQLACRDLQSDTQNCKTCGNVCDPLRANLCIAGGCVCGAISACAVHNWCASGTCTNCNTADHCGDSCVLCTGATPKCKANGSQCVQCNLDADCVNYGTCGPSGCWCSASNICTPKKVLGTLCAAGNECGSGNCTDAVCCDQPAAQCGGCKACNVQGFVGTCKNIPMGQDRNPPNCMLDVAQCKLAACAGDGTCNAPINASCGNNSCSSGSAPYALCQANGVCNTGTTNCQGFACNGNLCGSTCTVVTDVGCLAGYYCVGGTMCVAKLADGVVCGADNQCQNGHCLAAQSMYRCSALSSCALACQVINNAGTLCVAAINGTDPKNSCTANVANCKQDNCNGGTGATACDVADNASCGSTTCSGGSLTIPMCSSGACLNTIMSCSGFKCADASSCKSTCASDNDCLATNYCSGGNMCPSKKANNTACSGNNECTSTHCTNSVCCTEAMCNSKCTSCAAGNGASCGNVIAGGADPTATCTNDNSICQKATCDGAGACQPATNGVVCASPTCSGSTLTTHTCNGVVVGSCPTSSGPCPGNLKCADASTCKSSCSVSADCVSSYCCDNSACINTATKCGSSCSDCSAQAVNKACVSGNCGCNTDGDCAAPFSRCDTNLHACVVCLSHADCSPAMAKCTGGLCVICDNSSQCVSGGWGNTCNGMGACTCTMSNQCTGRTDSCNAGTCGCGAGAPCAVGKTCSSGVCS